MGFGPNIWCPKVPKYEQVIVFLYYNSNTAKTLFDCFLCDPSRRPGPQFGAICANLRKFTEPASAKLNKKHYVLWQNQHIAKCERFTGLNSVAGQFYLICWARLGQQGEQA